MPRGFYYTVAVLAALGLIPFAMIARSRTSTSLEPRIQPIRDMAKQPKFRAQAPNPLFADTRAMRPPVPGTVPHGALLDPVLETGRSGDAWVDSLPVPLTMQLLRRGEERFEIFCSPCHGMSGYGDGAVARRADRLQEGTWVQPSSFHTDLVRSRQVGHIFNTITNGIRNMPSYGGQIGVLDRWAIVAYVRALQKSQDAQIADVPADLRGKLR